MGTWQRQGNDGVAFLAARVLFFRLLLREIEEGGWATRVELVGLGTEEAVEELTAAARCIW